MTSSPACIKNRRITSQKKLSKQNLEIFQNQMLSLSQPDSVSQWLSLTDTMTNAESVGPSSKKRKRLSSNIISIAESGGHKYSRSYQDILYQLGITTEDDYGLISSEHEHTELPEYFPEPNNLPLLSGYITSWFQKFHPNEASLVYFLRECLFPLKVSTSGESIFTILHEFSGPFKTHDLKELSKGNEGIRFPLVKCHGNQPKSNILQTPAEEDLRSRSDFVFAASNSLFSEDVTFQLNLADNVPCLSSNSPTCAVAIVAEVKANSLQTSFAAAKNQWSSLAYLQIMERISICREKSYVGDENICQYGYLICGLKIVIWKMGLKWNRGKNRPSEIFDSYFTFPTRMVGRYDLTVQRQLELFVDNHKKILRWWLGAYLPSYIEDITNVVVKHNDPNLWRTSWQERAKNLDQDSGEKCTIGLLGASTLGEQPAPSVGADTHTVNRDSGETRTTGLLGASTLGEQPARPVRADTEGEAPQQNNLDTRLNGFCLGRTRHEKRCRKRVRVGNFCPLHQNG